MEEGYANIREFILKNVQRIVSKNVLIKFSCSIRKIHETGKCDQDKSYGVHRIN